MIYKKWDIVLVPFPFSDQTITKKRPGLILSPNAVINYKFDILITFMTSNLSSPHRIGDYHIQNWKEAKLPKPTLIRMKFATIEYTIIIKKLGSLTRKDQWGFKKEFKSFFNL